MLIVSMVLMINIVNIVKLIYTNCHNVLSTGKSTSLTVKDKWRKVRSLKRESAFQTNPIKSISQHFNRFSKSFKK